MSRDPHAKVPLTLRLPEHLRQALEARAKSNNRSLNSEVIAELEDFSSQQDMVVARFGSAGIASFMQALSSCAILAQIQTGKTFGEDPDTMSRALTAMQAILNGFRPNVRDVDHSAIEPSEATVCAAMEIARYSSRAIFLGEAIEEPAWLKAYVEKLRGGDKAQEDTSKQEPT